MQQASFLKYFEFNIPAAAMAAHGKNEERELTKHMPLLNVHIDFEKGKLLAEGDWQFIAKANKHDGNKWLQLHGNRVLFETRFCPVTVFNLLDAGCDGLIFPMEGSMKDAFSVINTSGFLIFNNQKTAAGNFSNCWNISFYLYDYQFDVCEVKFKLPLYVNTAVDETNN